MSTLPKTTRCVVVRFAVTVVAIGCALTTSPSCSSKNREGPDVTCADLSDGTWNACHDGIIAMCMGGGTVRYVVCDDKDVCEESWQYPGAYVCEQGDAYRPSQGTGHRVAACGLEFRWSACAACVERKCCGVAQECANDVTCRGCLQSNDAVGCLWDYTDFFYCLISDTRCSVECTS